MHRLRRSHYGNALMPASQTMQMFVAGNDQVCVSGKSTGENMIVVGIVLATYSCPALSARSGWSRRAVLTSSLNLRRNFFI